MGGFSVSSRWRSKVIDWRANIETRMQSASVETGGSTARRMCCCWFPGCCAEYCGLFRFAFCIKFKRTETDESVVFTAHVPGLNAEEFLVQVESGNVLKIIGNRTNQKVSSNGFSTSTGQLVKFYKLPKNILADEVRVDVGENEFITITVPKSKVAELSTV